MLMRIITLSKKYTFSLFFCLSLLLGLTASFAQCPTVANPNQSFCDNPYPTIASLAATNNGGGIVWYDTAVSTTPLSNSIALIDGEDYFAGDASGSCVVRQRVVATIYTAPIVQPRTQGFCEASTISDLQAAGNMIRWYDVATGGSPLLATTPLVDNTIYYASQINPITGCETSRRSVLVLVRILPEPTGASMQQLCAVPTPRVSDLNANGSNIRWYLSPSSGAELAPSTPLIEGQTYYAASSDDLCESLTRLGVLVDFTDPNNAGTNGQRNLCISDVPSTPPFNLFGLLGGNPDTIGTWTGPLVTTNGHLGTVNIASLTLAGSPYVFTYTVASGVCPVVTSTVTINILPLPNATLTVSPLNICAGDSPNVTITGTPNSTVTYTVNGAVRTIVIPASGTVPVPGTYAVTTEIVLVSVSTNATPSCSKALTERRTITVFPLPTAAISITNPDVCTGGATTILFTGTAGATITYTENGVTHTIILDAFGRASIDRNLTVTTTYTIVSVTSAGDPACTQRITGQTVTANVIPIPTATISVVAADICLGSNAIVTITGTPNATVTYTVNGNVRTAVLSPSGTYTVPPATYTENTTFTLISIATAGPPVCTRLLTGQSVNISVRTLPTAIISVNADTICIGGTAIVQITGTPNADVVYSENGVSHTIRLNASGVFQLPAANYNVQTTFILVSVTSTQAPFCSQIINQRVVLDVVPLPTVTSIVANPSPVCTGTSSTITITGTPGAIVTYTENGVSHTITINSQGFVDISQVFAATTTFIPIRVSTTGNPGCAQPVSGLSATVTVIPQPIATISATADTICSGENVTVTITGTPNATVVYTVNGSTRTITLSASGTYIVPPTTYTQDTEFVLVSVSTPAPQVCTQLLGQRLSIIVLPLPTAEFSLSPETICAGELATLTFNGTPNAIITYTANGATLTIPLNDVGFAFTQLSYSALTVFQLVSASTTGTPGCSQDIFGTETLNVIPLPTAAIVLEPATICASGTSIVRIAGTPNAQVTFSENGVVQTITLDATGNYTLPPATYTAAVRFVLISVTTTGTTSCFQLLNITTDLNVVSLPIASLLTPTPAICSGSSVRVTISGTPGAIVTYTQNGIVHTVTLNAFGVYDIDGSYTETTTFILTNVALPAPLNCSRNLSDQKIITVSQPPVAGNSTSIELCGSSNPVNLFALLGTSAQTGGTWLPALESGTGVFNPAVDPAGQYQYIVTGTAPCPNAVAIVNVTIRPQANAGSNSINTLCSNQDPVDLFLFLGPDAQQGGTWTPALASGTGMFNPSVDTAQVYTYTVLGTFPCPNDQAQVTIFITPGPDAGLPGTAAFCVNSVPADLFLSLNGTPQVGGIWSPALASGTGIFNPAIDAPGVYTYTFAGNQPCDDDTATVTVTINPIPDAGENGVSPQLCSNFSPVDLFGFLNGTPQTGGVWTPTLSSGNGIFNPAVDAPGIYTYTVGGTLCETDSATVTVNVTRSPNAGGLNAPLLINACITNTAVDLFTGLNGTQDLGTWTNTTTGAVVSNIFNAANAGEGSYQFTYTVTGGVSPCESDAATVTVIVSPLPNAGTYVGAPQNYCSDAENLDLFTLLTGNQAGGQWTQGNGTLVNNVIFIRDFIPGTYSFTYTISNVCGTDTETVQFTIQQPPLLTNANINVTAPVCIGSNAVVNFTGMPDGNYILTYNLSGSNTLSNDFMNVAITGSVGSFVLNESLIPNVGLTTITFVNIGSVATGCVSVLANVNANFTILPISDLESSNLSVANICFGNDATVAISNATGLPDGNYQFNITIPQGTPSTATTSPVTVIGGSGQFTLPASFFTAPGNYNLIINSITSLSSGCSNLNENATAAFQVVPIPDVTGVRVDATDACLSFSNQVFITNANNLADGIYSVTYQLSGANTATTTVTVTFAGGIGSFVIPANQLTNTGNVTVAITQLTSAAGICGVNGSAFNPVTFAVNRIGTPTIISNGNAFCAKDNPTVANLSANISGSDPVIWYNAPANGTAYSDSDLLVNGTTYYATFSSGTACQSAVRLEVTVDLTKCDDILIPDGFSPNGDNINDQFVIADLVEVYPNFKLEIYNRYGNIVYKGNRSTPNWDGTSTAGGLKMGDNTLPAGVYFYVLEFNDGARKPKQGRIYLSR